MLMRLFGQSSAMSSSQQQSNSSPIPWIVRPANLQDQDAVNQLLETSYSALLPRDYPPEILTKAIPRITRARPDLLSCGTWYVVEHPITHELVGCGGWTPIAPSNLKTISDLLDESQPPHLRHFATHPDWLRQGIGTEIWKRILRDLHSDSRSAKNITALEVFSTLTAKSFYASLGFEVVKDIEIPLGEDILFPSILMRRPSSKIDDRK